MKIWAEIRVEASTCQGMLEISGTPKLEKERCGTESPSLLSEETNPSTGTLTLVSSFQAVRQKLSVFKIPRLQHFVMAILQVNVSSEC